MLGEDIGILNAGFIADSQQILTDSDIDYTTLQEEISKNKIYQIL